MATKKNNKKKPDDIKTQPYKRDLTVALTRDELDEVAQRMSHKIADRDIREAELKERAKRDKSALKDLETDIRRYANTIRDKAELREIQCERRFNFTTGRVIDVRTDTGVVLSERDMTEEERQKEIDFGDVDDEFEDDDEDEAAE